jgi:hypothetical protein
MFFTDFRDSIEAKQRTLKLKTVIRKEIFQTCTSYQTKCVILDYTVSLKSFKNFKAI